MWIDDGIDSGNIIATGLTDLTGIQSLQETHLRVMEHAHNLCIEVIQFLASGRIQGIPQASITSGKTYYNKDWNLWQKLNLIRNLRSFIRYNTYGKQDQNRTNIKTVSLESRET